MKLSISFFYKRNPKFVGAFGILDLLSFFAKNWRCTAPKNYPRNIPRKLFTRYRVINNNISPFVIFEKSENIDTIFILKMENWRVNS